MNPNIFDFTLSDQLLLFAWGAALGFAMAAVYELLRIWRKAFGGGAVALFFQDVVFFSLCGLVSFLYILIFNHGTVRIYVFISHILGAFIYSATLGRLINYASGYIIGKIKSFLCAVKNKAVYPLLKKLNLIIDKKNKKEKDLLLLLFPISFANKRVKKIKGANKG